MRAEREAGEVKVIEEPSRRKGEIKASVGEEVRRIERGETERVFGIGKGWGVVRGRGMVVKGRQGLGCDGDVGRMNRAERRRGRAYMERREDGGGANARAGAWVGYGLEGGLAKRMEGGCGGGLRVEVVEGFVLSTSWGRVGRWVGKRGQWRM